MIFLCILCDFIYMYVDYIEVYVKFRDLKFGYFLCVRNLLKLKIIIKCLMFLFNF